ncbi:hypothetical protein SB861_54890, partial [Paraburkholderia sp. SIMBA_049]
ASPVRRPKPVKVLVRGNERVTAGGTGGFANAAGAATRPQAIVSASSAERRVFITDVLVV